MSRTARIGAVGVQKPCDLLFQLGRIVGCCR